MNRLIEILKEAQLLTSNECDEYFQNNAFAHTGIYQLCKQCKHVLVKHWVNRAQNDEIKLGPCRQYEEENTSCLCREFK